jgi:hypothetical protein
MTEQERQAGAAGLAVECPDDLLAQRFVGRHQSVGRQTVCGALRTQGPFF